jgi:protease IV
MNFVRGAWRILVGIKDGLVLLFMLLFFGLLAAALTARPGTKAIGTGALVMELKGSIVEQPASVGLSEALNGGNQMKQYRLRDILAALDAAATDDRVKTVVLDLDGFVGGGQVALGDVGEALDKVRAKKPVLAFATGYSDDAYQLAAHASEIWLDPMGLALFQGPGGSRLYYKGLFERVGANIHVYKVGKFKSAVEPFILDKASPEAKQANQALVASLWQGWQADVAKARPKAQLAALIADPAAAVAASGDPASAALKAAVVDKLADRATFNKRVAALAGAGKKDQAYARIELKTYAAAKARKTGDKAIGVVTVAGVISDGEAEAGSAGGETIGKIIDKAVASDKYKALVLRVDSPGGSALASERIRVALAAARAKGMPVVVSMGNVAASGGYWVSMAADKVFAEPTTITGSIGVFGVIPTFENSLKKIGVTTDGVTTTPLSGQPDIFGGTNAAFDGVIQTSVESTYRRFINLVSGARKLTPARVDEIAQGRVWDGGTARQMGLVDAFGGIEEAIADAAQRAKLDPKEPHAVWLDKAPGWREALSAMFSQEEEDKGGSTDLLSTLARQRMSIFAGVAEDARMMMSSSAVQARCLECPVAATPVKPDTLLQLFVKWMAA